jgi:hypothetical protein
MILFGNIVFQAGFSIDSGKTFVQTGSLPPYISSNNKNKLPIEAIVKDQEDSLLIFPRHYMNKIIYWDKYSKVPFSVWSRKLSLSKPNPLKTEKCLIENNRVYSQSPGETVYQLTNEKSIGSSEDRVVPKSSIIWFSKENKNLLKNLPNEQSKEFYILNENAFRDYALFWLNMNALYNDFPLSISKKGDNPAVRLEHGKQCLVMPNQKDEDIFYLAPNFISSASLLLKLTVDSVGKPRELQNFFLPVSYQALYIMFEFPVISRVILGNSTLLNTMLLRKLLRKYFFIKTGVTLNSLGLEITADPKGIYDVLQKKSDLTKKRILIDLLKCFFRALSITVKKEFCTFYFTFDFYSMSFSVSILVFPLKYSAYIDKHGKRPGVEILSADSPQVTYY